MLINTEGRGPRQPHELRATPSNATQSPVGRAKARPSAARRQIRTREAAHLLQAPRAGAGQWEGGRLRSSTTRPPGEQATEGKCTSLACLQRSQQGPQLMCQRACGPCRPVCARGACCKPPVMITSAWRGGAGRARHKASARERVACTHVARMPARSRPRVASSAQHLGHGI